MVDQAGVGQRLSADHGSAADAAQRAAGESQAGETHQAAHLEQQIEVAPVLREQLPLGVRDARLVGRELVRLLRGAAARRGGILVRLDAVARNDVAEYFARREHRQLAHAGVAGLRQQPRQAAQTVHLGVRLGRHGEAHVGDEKLRLAPLLLLIFAVHG